MYIRRAIRSDVPAILRIAKANPATSQWPEAEYVQALENIAARRVVMVAALVIEVSRERINRRVSLVIA